jgi:hypothetical protein
LIRNPDLQGVDMENPSGATIYNFHSGAKTAVTVVGVLLCVLIITIPIGIYIIIRASGGRVQVTQEGLTAKSIGTKKFRFSEVSRLGVCHAPVQAGGIGGALARKKVGGDVGVNMCFMVGKKTKVFIASMYENHQQMFDQVSQILGKPVEEVTIGALKLKWPEQV